MIGVAPQLASMMTEQFVSRRSGILTATRGKLKRLYCFERGSIVHVASNVLEEQLDECLVQEGLLSTADREALVRQVVAGKNGKRLTPLLLESGLLEREAMERAAEARVRKLTSSTLEWPQGELRFDHGLPNLDGEIKVSLTPVSLLMDHSRQYPKNPEMVRVRVGRPQQRIRIDRKRLAALGDPDLDKTAEAVLARCAGASTIADALAVGREDEEPTLRALYGLLLLEVIRTLEKGAPAFDRDDPVTRSEMMSRIAKADGADHYLVLGVNRNATREDVRSAYYDLARRLHPDRLRSGELGDLLPAIEGFFSQVTEAYNTLHDSERRKEYDRTLEEMAAKKAADKAQSDTSFLARQNFLRGKELADKKRYAEALQFLENAVELDGTQARYFLALGLLQSRNPRLRAEAERNLLQVTRLEPHASQAYLALGDMYRRAGRKDEAVSMYHEVLRWDAGNADAREGLARLGAA